MAGMCSSVLKASVSCADLTLEECADAMRAQLAMTPAPVAAVTDKGIVAHRRGLDALAAQLPAADQV